MKAPIGASQAHRRGLSAPLQPPQPGQGTGPPRGPAGPGMGMGLAPERGRAGLGVRPATVSASDGVGARPGAVPAGRGWGRGLAPERGWAHLLGRAQVVGAAGQDAVPALHRAPLHRVRAELRVHHLQRARPARRGHRGPGPAGAAPRRPRGGGAVPSASRSGRARGGAVPPSRLFPRRALRSLPAPPSRGKGLRLQHHPSELLTRENRDQPALGIRDLPHAGTARADWGGHRYRCAGAVPELRRSWALP